MDTERTDIETPASEPILNAYKTFKNQDLVAPGNNIGFFKKKRKKNGIQGKMSKNGEYGTQDQNSTGNVKGDKKRMKLRLQKKQAVPILAFDKMMKTGEFPLGEDDDEDEPIETNKTVELINKKIQEMEQQIGLKNNFNW